MGHAMMRLILLSLLIVFGHHAIRGIWGLDVLGIRKVDHVDRAQNDSYCKSSIISISSTDRVSFWNDFAIFRILFIFFFIMFIQFNTGIQRYTAHIACCGLPRPTQASQPHEHLAHLHCKLRFLVVTWLRRRVLKLRRIQAGARWNPKQKPTKKHADITPWSHLSKWGFRVQVLKMASKKSKKLPFQQNAWLRWKVTRQISWVLVGYLCRMWLVIDFRSKHFDHTIFGRQTIGIYGDDCPGCQVRHHARRQPCISTYQILLTADMVHQRGLVLRANRQQWGPDGQVLWSSDALPQGLRDKHGLGLSVKCLEYHGSCLCISQQTVTVTIWRFTLCGWYTRLVVAHSMPPMGYWTNFDDFSWLTIHRSVSRPNPQSLMFGRSGFVKSGFSDLCLRTRASGTASRKSGHVGTKSRIVPAVRLRSEQQASIQYIIEY